MTRHGVEAADRKVRELTQEALDILEKLSGDSEFLSALILALPVKQLKGITKLAFGVGTLLSLFPGIQEYFLRHVLEAPELRAIVMRTFGSGNAPQKPWLIRLLKEASERGVTIVNVSQCMAGAVEMGRYDTGYQLQKAGVISGRDSTVEGAVTKLMFLQARYKDPQMIRKYMNQSLCGEITV